MAGSFTRESPQLHNAARARTFKFEAVFSVVRTNIYFAIFDIVVKNKSNVV